MPEDKLEALIQNFILDILRTNRSSNKKMYDFVKGITRNVDTKYVEYDTINLNNIKIYTNFITYTKDDYENILYL